MKRNSVGHEILFLAAAAVLSFLLGRLQTNGRTSGHIDFVGRAVASISAPPALLLERGLDGSGQFWESIAKSTSLKAENNRLKQLEASWRLYQAQVDQLEDRIRHLQGIKGFTTDPARKKVKASVISYDPYGNRFTISAGSGAGVEPGLAVVSSDGLIGVVESVDPKRSQVLLISSPKLKIGAMILPPKITVPPTNPNPPVGPPATTQTPTVQKPAVPQRRAIAGIIKGLSQERAILGYAETVLTQIKPGDQVVTSVHSERIPPYIPIGRVLEYHRLEALGTEEAIVRLSANIADVREVIVIK